MKHLKGYFLLGLMAVPVSRIIPGFTAFLLLAILLALLFKACYNLYRSHKALQLDSEHVRENRPPQALLAWQSERRKSPLERRYEIGWLCSIAILGILSGTLPVQIAGRLLGYIFFAELLVLLFFIVRLRFAQAVFLRSVSLQP